MAGPLPRFRIYTGPESYAEAARGAILGGAGARAVGTFERAVAELCGSAFGIAVPRARAGIFRAIQCLIEPGQKVILSPYTIHGVVNMVIAAGGVPVFSDVDPRTCNLDPKGVIERLDDETGAVLVTHLHGLAMDVEKLAEVCRERGIAFVEDAAQAFATRLNGRPVGTFGDAGIFSFGMYKNLTTFLGGMVVTSREDLAQSLRSSLDGRPYQRLGVLLAEVANALTTDIATHPLLFRHLVFPLFRFGHLREIEWLNKRVRVEDDPRLESEVPEDYLRRMRPLQARIGMRRIGRVDEDAAARIAFAHRYHDGLADLEELTLPPLRADGSHTYAYFPIQYRDRHALVRSLLEQGCDLAVQHLKNCADLPCFEPWARECPGARRAEDTTILLPTYPRYSEVDVDRNVRAIRAFFGASRG